ncbi:MAG: YbjQ family protein [Gemmatimonadota bacterium]
MMITPSSEIAGRRVTESLGLVRGNTIRARHLGQDILAVFRNMIGGEVREYTKMMAESREQAIDRMIEEARSLGADAVINLRFTTAYVMGSAAEILVYGDAVRLDGQG